MTEMQILSKMICTMAAIMLKYCLHFDYMSELQVSKAAYSLSTYRTYLIVETTFVMNYQHTRATTALHQSLISGKRQGILCDLDNVLRRPLGRAPTGHEQHGVGGRMDAHRPPVPQPPLGAKHLHLRLEVFRSAQRAQEVGRSVDCGGERDLLQPGNCGYVFMSDEVSSRYVAEICRQERPSIAYLSFFSLFSSMF